MFQKNVENKLFAGKSMVSASFLENDIDKNNGNLQYQLKVIDDKMQETQTTPESSLITFAILHFEDSNT